MTIANEFGGRNDCPCPFCNLPSKEPPTLADAIPQEDGARSDSGMVPVNGWLPGMVVKEDGAREGVIRWRVYPYQKRSDLVIQESPAGEYVRYDDHLAEVARLTKERDQWKANHDHMGKALCGLNHVWSGLEAMTAERDALDTEVSELCATLEKARAELAAARSLMREGARHIGPMIYFSEPDLAKRIDAFLADQITPTPAAERGGGQP
jgi:hypothetical protein